MWVLNRGWWWTWAVLVDPRRPKKIMFLDDERA